MSNIEVAAQGTYKVGDYEFPSLAQGQDGSITVASFVDLVMVCLAAAASGNTQMVNDILKANDVVVRDRNGKIFFPKANNAQG